MNESTANLKIGQLVPTSFQIAGVQGSHVISGVCKSGRSSW